MLIGTKIRITVVSLKSNIYDDFTNQRITVFRAVRNFVIDVRQMPPNVGTGIHWQVAQATSLHNIRFEMRTDAGNRQQGIFMDNGRDRLCIFS